LDEYVFDQMSPVDAPVRVADVTLALDCGRTCSNDQNCQGYVIRRNVNPVDSTTCSIFYAISGFVFDPDHASYVIRNASFYKNL
jgi:hypothetical protein